MTFNTIFESIEIKEGTPCMYMNLTSSVLSSIIVDNFLTNNWKPISREVLWRKTLVAADKVHNMYSFMVIYLGGKL